jgi:HEAT repeat protein
VITRFDRRLFLIPLVASICLAGSATRAEISDSPREGTQQSDRYERSRMGTKPEEWARRLDDSRPDVRLEAVKLLSASPDPAVHEYLMQAVEKPDARVAAAAVDALGKIGAKDASGFLSERLFLAATSAGLRQRILVALGRIKDPSASQRVLDFAAGEPDGELRATAIRVLGEMGDSSVRAELRDLGERERDPTFKTLLSDADAKITAREAAAGRQ